MLLGVFVTAGVISTATSSTSAAPVDSAPLAETRPAATPEQAYELSLPVLGHWIDNEFDNAWIVTANTLEAAAANLDRAARDDLSYASWVATFEEVVAVAAAVADADQDSARTAFAPLLAAHSGPYADVAVDLTLSSTPYDDVEVRLEALDEAIAADDRNEVRAAAGDVAEALAEVVLAAQVDIPDDAGRVLGEIIPAFEAITGVHDAVLFGDVADAAESAALLHAALADFEAWYEDETR